MIVTRDIVLDLIPSYLSGDASADTRAAVEAFIEHDPQIADMVRNAARLEPAAAALTGPSTDVEFESLRRAKRMLIRRELLLGMAIFFTAIAASVRIDIVGGRVRKLEFFLQGSPVEWALCLALAGTFWFLYARGRRRLRMEPPRR